jgi:hypothetical protein
VELRFHQGLASISILMSELTTQKAPDINAFRGAVEDYHVARDLPTSTEFGCGAVYRTTGRSSISLLKGTKGNGTPQWIR